MKEGLKTNRILIVDDDEDSVQLAKRYLKELSNNIIVTATSSGRDALVKVEIERPDLIIMDAILPELNGWTTTHYLKENPIYRNIPVISMTKLEYESSAMSNGSDAFLKKPICKETFLNTVKKYISEID